MYMSPEIATLLHPSVQLPSTPRAIGLIVEALNVPQVLCVSLW